MSPLAWRPIPSTHPMRWVASQKSCFQVGVQVWKPGSNSVDAACYGFCTHGGAPNRATWRRWFMLIGTKSGERSFFGLSGNRTRAGNRKDCTRMPRARSFPTSVCWATRRWPFRAPSGLAYADSTGKLTLTQVMVPGDPARHGRDSLSWGAAHSLSEEWIWRVFPALAADLPERRPGMATGGPAQQPESPTLGADAAALGLMISKGADGARDWPTSWKGGGLITHGGSRQLPGKDRPAVHEGSICG